VDNEGCSLSSRENNVNEDESENERSSNSLQPSELLGQQSAKSATFSRP